MTKKETTAAADIEFSRPFDLQDLEGARTQTITIEPTADEAARIASRIGVNTVQSMKAHINLSRAEHSKIIKVDGRIKAHVVQSCVVTLDPVEDTIDETFEAYFQEKNPKTAAKTVSFVQEKHKRKKDIEDPETPFLDEKDDPEVVENGTIDLGEVTVQFLSLAINPFPRTQAAIDNAGGDDDFDARAEENMAKRNPFAILKD